MNRVTLTPGSVALAELRAIWSGAPVALAAEAYAAIDAASESIARIVASGRTVYGVNTGFGLLAQTRIPPERLAELQTNLVMSHSCGLGDDLSRPVMRLAMAMKVIGLARGHSGVRRLVVDRLLELLERDAIPCVPAQGSVGASGDLAPLGHLGAALLGEGRIALEGRIMPPARRFELWAWSRSRSAPRKGSRSSTARRSPLRLRSMPCSPASACSAPP
jgi:histidine ammonia-lyase